MEHLTKNHMYPIILYAPNKEAGSQSFSRRAWGERILDALACTFNENYIGPTDSINGKLIRPEVFVIHFSPRMQQEWIREELYKQLMLPLAMLPFDISIRAPQRDIKARDIPTIDLFGIK